MLDHFFRSIFLQIYRFSVGFSSGNWDSHVNSVVFFVCICMFVCITTLPEDPSRRILAQVASISFKIFCYFMGSLIKT